MYISNISLKNYRNIKELKLELINGINIFYGDNAQGKTNFLEAIYLGAIGRSHRTKKDKELINFNSDSTNVRLVIKEEDENNEVIDKIDIQIKKEGKKGVAINGIAINKIGELFGYLSVVIFSPEDLFIIKNAPKDRRRFIDMEMSQIDTNYYYFLASYYKVLKQRNHILKNTKKDNNFKSLIEAFDVQLVYFGSKIITKREGFLRKLENIANSIHNQITGGSEKLEILYKKSVSKDDFMEKLSNNIQKDILYKMTLLGPHKDDVEFLINGINAKDFGSQGQQRSVALSVKLAEIQLIKNEKNKIPILLLDDVLSELDKKRQQFLINSIKNMQVIITCTGAENIFLNLNKNNSIFYVENGKIFKKYY